MCLQPFVQDCKEIIRNDLDRLYYQKALNGESSYCHFKNFNLISL